MILVPIVCQTRDLNKRNGDKTTTEVGRGPKDRRTRVYRLNHVSGRERGKERSHLTKLTLDIRGLSGASLGSRGRFLVIEFGIGREVRTTPPVQETLGKTDDASSTVEGEGPPLPLNVPETGVGSRYGRVLRGWEVPGERDTGRLRWRVPTKRHSPVLTSRWTRPWYRTGFRNDPNLRWELEGRLTKGYPKLTFRNWGRVLRDEGERRRTLPLEYRGPRPCPNNRPSSKTPDVLRELPGLSSCPVFLLVPPTRSSPSLSVPPRSSWSGWSRLNLQE